MPDPSLGTIPNTTSPCLNVHCRPPWQWSCGLLGGGGGVSVPTNNYHAQRNTTTTGMNHATP